MEFPPKGGHGKNTPKGGHGGEIISIAMALRAIAIEMVSPPKPPFGVVTISWLVVAFVIMEK